MRASAEIGVCATSIVLLFSHVALVFSEMTEETGYHPEDYHDEPVDVDNIHEVCPSERVLRIRDKCRLKGVEVACIKLRCCDTHSFVAGRCIQKTVDPCSLSLCEQACTVQGKRVWCSCHGGYKFNPVNYQKKVQPYCVDVDECQLDNGGCEQRCVNDLGGYHCECTPPDTLSSDRKTCESVIEPAAPMPLIRTAPRCYAPCDSVAWLTRKVQDLGHQMRAMQEIIKKLQEDGSPGPSSSFPSSSSAAEKDSFPEGTSMYRVLDSTAPLEGGYCRCERGPRGPPGAPGSPGPRGDVGPKGPRGRRGSKGSIELMLMLIADIRHDIRNLEARVYKHGEKPDRFNLQKAWRRHNRKEAMDSEISERHLEAYTMEPLEGARFTPKPSSRGSKKQLRDHTKSEWKTSTTPASDLDSDLDLDLELDPLVRLQILANATDSGEDEEQELEMY